MDFLLEHAGLATMLAAVEPVAIGLVWVKDLFHWQPCPEGKRGMQPSSIQYGILELPSTMFEYLSKMDEVA
jgi:hypothetical protein